MHDCAGVITVMLHAGNGNHFGRMRRSVVNAFADKLAATVRRVPKAGRGPGYPSFLVPRNRKRKEFLTVRHTIPSNRPIAQCRGAQIGLQCHSDRPYFTGSRLAPGAIARAVDLVKVPVGPNNDPAGQIIRRGAQTIFRFIENFYLMPVDDEF